MTETVGTVGNVVKKLEKADVKLVIATFEKPFTNKDIWAEMDIRSGPGKAALRNIMHELKEAGLVVSDGYGHWRNPDGVLEAIDWQSAVTTEMDIHWPFDLDLWIKVYPKCLALVAGSSNAGKTAFVHQFINQNVAKWKDKIDLYNNETSPQQMKERLTPFNYPTPPPFKTYERAGRFQDVIKGDRISVIDYLSIDGEPYLLQAEVNQIWQKLTTGLCLVALQKPPGRDDAFGGFMLRSRPQLYVSLDKDLMKVVKAKTPRDPENNPNGWQYKFKLKQGLFFESVERFYGFDQ